jgi:hypothetical protein
MQWAVAKLAAADAGDVEDGIDAAELLETGGKSLLHAALVTQVTGIIAGDRQARDQVEAMRLIAADDENRVALLRRAECCGFGDARGSGDEEYSTHK